MARFILQILLLLLVLVAAWRSGGKPERLVASIYACMLALDVAWLMVSGPDDHASYQSLYTSRFILDLAALASVVFVALRYHRWWTLWVGSVQCLAVMAHLLRALDMPIQPLAYAVMERWPIWIALVLTGIGVVSGRLRQDRHATST